MLHDILILRNSFIKLNIEISIVLNPNQQQKLLLITHKLNNQGRQTVLWK